MGEVVSDPFDEGCRHVASYSLYLGGGSFVGLKVLGKTLNGGSVFSGRAKQQALSVQIEEEGYIPMASPARGFVNPNGFYIREIPCSYSVFYIVMKHSPNPGVMLTNEISHGQYWHFLAKSHHQCLEQQGKSRTCSCPRNCCFANGMALVAINTRNSSVQERRMLKKVQMAPAILRSVVGFAKGPACGAGQETSSLEINVDVQPLLGHREENLFNLPRRIGSSGNWILLDLRLEKNGHGPHGSEASINTSGGKPCPRVYSTTHGESLAMTICEPNTSAARSFSTSTTNPANSDVPSAALKTSSSGEPNPATFEEFRSDTRKCGSHWTFKGLNARTVSTWDKFVWALRIHKISTPGALNAMPWSCSR